MAVSLSCRRIISQSVVGESVAICEQISDLIHQRSRGKKSCPNVYPGTVIDEALLDERQDNLLAAIHQNKNIFGIATLR